MHKLVAALAGTLALLAGCESERADDSRDAYPRKPIKVVVPFSAGGGSDTFARLIQKAIRDEGLLEEPLVIVNVPGAGGTIGSRRVKDASPDGYTILNLHGGIFSAKHAGQASYGPEAFEPIVGTGRSGLVMCVQDESPHRTLGDLMVAATAEPDSVLFGMAPGTPAHFAGLRLEAAAEGAAFRYVVSGGGAKRFHDLLGGHIDVSPFSLAEYARFKEGGLRALAYFGAERDPQEPDLPTGHEQGYALEMTNVQYWWAPRGTPPEVIERLADAFEATMQTEAVRERLRELRVDPVVLRDESLTRDLAIREEDYAGVALVDYNELPDVALAVGVLLALLLIAFLLERILSRPKATAPPNEENSRINWNAALMLAALALYILLLQVVKVPFAWATLLAVPALGFLSGARTPRRIAALAVLGCVVGWGCFFLFTKVLVTDLP